MRILGEALEVRSRTLEEPSYSKCTWGRVQFKTVCHAARPVSSEAHAEKHRSWSAPCSQTPAGVRSRATRASPCARDAASAHRHRGLDVCAEIVASATPTQLASVLDLDLWRSAQPGHDEQFDTERFGEWLEVLVDAGGTVAAQTVAAMDEHLVVAGLSRYVRVFDPAAIAAIVDGEPLDIDVPPHTGPECEVGGYLVRGITTDAWDAIVALLLALDADHHDCFHAVMRECRRLSNSMPEVDGLDDLLMEPEQLLHDVAVDREHRRAQQGYSTPADARAFLLMARQRRRASQGRAVGQPARGCVLSGRRRHDRIWTTPPPRPGGPVRTASSTMLDVLAEAGLVPERPRALLEGHTLNRHVSHSSGR